MKRFALFYLRFVAKLSLRLNHPTVIGISGSVGKTSARNALFAVLKDHASTKAIFGNSETGIPLGILGLEPTDYTKKDWLSLFLKAPLGLRFLSGTKYVIIEMGIDDPDPPKNMEYLLSIVRPDISISLNISATHTMQFEKLLEGRSVTNKKKFLLDKIAEEDTKIITRAFPKVAIYNGENEYISKYVNMYKKRDNPTQFMTFGSNKSNTASYRNYSVTTKKCTFDYFVSKNKRTREFTLRFTNFLLPIAYQETFAPIILACQSLGLPLSQIKTSLEKNFELPHGRSSLLSGKNGSIIIDSTYNASKESVLTFLDLGMDIKKQTKRPFVFIFGDMRELGGQEESEHKEVAKKINSTVDYLYCVGPLTKEYIVPLVNTARDNNKSTVRQVEWFKNAVHLGVNIKDHIPSDSIIIIKGSQNKIYLEEAVKFLLDNPTDQKKLCRQSDFWMSKKSEYFNIEKK